MKKTLARIFLLILFIGIGLGSHSQTIDALKEQIRRAQEEIRLNNELLSKNRQNKRLSQTQLKLIQSRIKSRQDMIGSLEKQIKLINSDITTKNHKIDSMNTRLTELKREYGKMIYASYKDYKLNNHLTFLFSSRDFNDVTRRIEYMNRFNEMLVKKAAEIEALSGKMKVEVSELDKQLLELDNTKKAQSAEVENLNKDEKQYKTTVANLTAAEQKIQKVLREKQAQINRAQQQIQRIIAEEARKAKNKPKTTAEQQYDIKLSGQFDQNMGKLAYPVRGVIIDNYGVHPHPTIAGLTVNNRGINIATDRGAEVRCVFEGVVTRIFFFQGLNNSVMVRHGNYITVYSNLATVSVKTGEKVMHNHVLGRVSSGNDTEEHMVHFEIWKESVNLNPGQCLRK